MKENRNLKEFARCLYMTLEGTVWVKSFPLLWVSKISLNFSFTPTERVLSWCSYEAILYSKHTFHFLSAYYVLGAILRQRVFCLTHIGGGEKIPALMQPTLGTRGRETNENVRIGWLLRVRGNKSVWESMARVGIIWNRLVREFSMWIWGSGF